MALARLAFAPEALAHQPEWLAAATALLLAYQRTHPEGLDVLALAATPRIAALDLLTRPPAPSVDAWIQHHQALRNLLDGLSRTEAALRATLMRPIA
ncbi:hypothetical protein [Streptomyces sp. NBC_01601]|uniref:hypothetical protein n=1 Tax=Streptomyces sp. NBC_01601 TaxID=2975892 RepID=UPI002E27C34F|nr:hypothetical protein [Streptomyces sp. NBC_01601]